MQRIVLTEYEPRYFSREELSDEIGNAIYERWGTRLEVEFPSPRTGHRWRITPLGWVGVLPLGPVALEIQSKVPIASVLRMFEYAYGLRSVEFMKDLVGCASLEDFYSKLAAILSARVLRRAQNGLYRGYVGIEDAVGAVRGRIDLRRHISKPPSATIDCSFEEHTGDLIENQILTWTLSRILHNPSLAAPARPLVRNAWRTMNAASSSRPIQARECVGRLYNRLNADYEQMHLLCRFFLEHTGPTITDGKHETVPFLVNMARLFELFVAQWLRAHLPPRYAIRWQDRATMGEHDMLRFDIDMVLHDRVERRDVAVIDAKYKDVDRPANDDVAQVTLYAQLRRCRDAVLVYPSQPTYPFDAVTRDHRIRTLWFDLLRPIEVAGEEFTETLLTSVK